jgi:hypothetical protein
MGARLRRARGSTTRHSRRGQYLLDKRQQLVHRLEMRDAAADDVLRTPAERVVGPQRSDLGNETISLFWRKGLKMDKVRLLTVACRALGVTANGIGR